jgi:putative spermidine/putrescine transport system permease protein
MSHKSFVWLCLLPLAVVTTAFFLLPMARLVVTGAEGPQGLAGYLAILTEPRYRATLINTVLLATATTIATLAIATVAGMFLQRHRFPGRAVLIAMLTFPLAFPGVVVGFLIILLAGRQGLIGDLTNRVFGEKLVFAYSIYGLFLGYLYFGRSAPAPGRCNAMSCCRHWGRLSWPRAPSPLPPRWAHSAPRSRWRPISMCCRC